MSTGLLRESTTPIHIMVFIWWILGLFTFGTFGEICLLKRHFTSDKILNFFTLYPYVLHYGPMDSSKNGEPVLSYKHALPNPDEAWHEPEPEDPLSLVDQVGK